MSSAYASSLGSSAFSRAFATRVRGGFGACAPSRARWSTGWSARPSSDVSATVMLTLDHGEAQHESV